MRIWFGLILNNEGVMEKRGKCVAAVVCVCVWGGGVKRQFWLIRDNKQNCGEMFGIRRAEVNREFCENG
jgi:hypothetical protein